MVAMGNITGQLFSFYPTLHHITNLSPKNVTFVNSESTTIT